MPEEWSWARRAAQPWFDSDTFLAMSGAAALDLLREHGFGYRMTLFYDDWRLAHGRAVSSRYVKALDPDQYVPRRYMAEVDLARWHRPESLRYRLEGVFRDKETGVEETQYLALMTNKEMTKGAAIREGRPLFSVDVSGIPGELISIELVGAYHLKGTPF